MPHRAPPGWLADTVWRLTGDSAGGPEAQLILLPSGRVGAAWRTELARWRVTSDRLSLFDADGSARATFALSAAPTPALHGSTIPGGKPCLLSYLRDVPVLLPAGTSRPSPASGRDNLVILRAGPDSLHSAWMLDCPQRARNRGLCLCTYAAGTTETETEHRAHYPRQQVSGPGPPVGRAELVEQLRRRVVARRRPAGGLADDHPHVRAVPGARPGTGAAVAGTGQRRQPSDHAARGGRRGSARPSSIPGAVRG